MKKYVQEDVQAESPTVTRPSATYLETDGVKKKKAVSKRPALTDLEMDCGKFTTATDNDHLQDQFIIRSYQTSSKTLAKDDSLSNFVCSCSDVRGQRWCQHLTNAFGGVGTIGIEWAIVMTMQPSVTKMKTLTACEQALWEKSQANWDVGVRCRERKWELFVSPNPHSFAGHSYVCLPLKMQRLLSGHNISW